MLCILVPTTGMLMHSVDPVLPSREIYLGQTCALVDQLVLPNKCYSE